MNLDIVPIRANLPKRKRAIMMKSKTKEQLVVMEAMGIGDDHDRNFKGE